MVLHT